MDFGKHRKTKKVAISPKTVTQHKSQGKRKIEEKDPLQLTQPSGKIDPHLGIELFTVFLLYLVGYCSLTKI